MYDIVGKRNLWFAISAILTIPGLLFIILGGLKPSIDFTGGTEWEVRYADQPSVTEMTEALAELDHPDALVTELPDGFLRIRTEPIDLVPPQTAAPSPSESASADPSASGDASPSASGSASADPSASPSDSASPCRVGIGKPVGRAVPSAAGRGNRVRGARGSARGSVRTRRSAQRAHRRSDHRCRAHPHARPS